jgi:hypothetical protein
MDADALALHLGRAVMNSQYFEMAVGVVYARSLGLRDEVGLQRAGKVGVNSALAKIRSRMGLPGYALDPVAVSAWLKLAQRAMEARNVVIHSPWFAETPGGELTRRIPRSSGMMEFADPTDVERTVILLHDAYVDGLRLCGDVLSIA